MPLLFVGQSDDGKNGIIEQMNGGKVNGGRFSCGKLNDGAVKLESGNPSET